MPRQVRTPLYGALCAILILPLAACSYHFQQSHNPLIDLGIHKIYVAAFRNLTYRPGVEQYFTTAMVREIGRSNSFELVNNEKEADAVLSGAVTTAESSVGAQNYVHVAADRDLPVASEYIASVSCRVVLRDRRGRQIFAQDVTGDKVHPGSAQLGDAGATAPLTNDSEQRLAVQFLATQMMASVYQRMIDTF